MTPLMWGQVPVPYSVLWSAENEFFLGSDPTTPGLLAVCNPSRQGEGKPVFGKPHMNRQRRTIALGLCDLCGRPLKGRAKVSLSHARPRVGAGHAMCVMQVEPLLHKECAAISLRHCPSLKRDIRGDSLMVRLVTRYRVQFAQLTGDATEEFCGARHSGAVGHAKVELLAWRDMDAAWLERRMGI